MSLPLWILMLFLASFSQNVEIMDRSDVVTSVSELKYCYEEKEGSEIYINKYDNFFVRKGEAVIRVDFKNIQSVIFDGPMMEIHSLSKTSRLM